MKKILSISAAMLLLAVTAFAQGLTVKGVVVDEDNVPMIGVGVVIEGTTTGTLTDMDGQFSFKVPNRDVKISFSFLGYNTVTLPYSDQSMRVVLTPESNTLDDVVVVAYGVQRRESVVGSISSVSSEELKQMGTPNLSTALAGKVAGITFTVPSGRPGADDAKLYVRGVSTFSGDSSPLVLVDGVEREYSSVDPEDIAQISVLKDASATAVYGVRGANGAILITTKRGTKGAPKFNANYTFTLQQPTRMPKFLGSYDHAVLRNESLANDGGLPVFTQEQIDHYKLGDDPYLYPDNDYVSDFIRKVTPMHKLNIGVRGGSDLVRYYVALSGLAQDGIYKQFDGRYPSNANSKRLNLRANLDFALTKTTDLTLDLNGRLQQRQNNSQGLDNNSLFQEMYEAPPMAYPYLLPDGSYGAPLMGVNSENLLAMLSDYGYTRLMTNVLEGTVKLNQRLDFITTGLNARGSVSFNSYYDTGTKVSYRPPTYLYKGEGVEKELVVEETAPAITALDGNGHRERINIEAGLEYNRTFENHAFGGLLLYTMNRSHTNAALPQAFLGYAARATYAYKGTYLFEVNCGYNGSDQFAKEYRYALFPSFAIGYVISNSPFLKDNPVLTYAKARVSYGTVGNDKIGSDRFIYLQTYSKDGDAYFFGKDDAFGGQASLTEGDMGNEHVTWEVGKKTNIGIDMTFFNDLDLGIDLFDEHRENIFTSRNTTPKTLGISSAKENIGRVMNRGFEVEVHYRKTVSRDFDWNAGGMISYARNKVLYKDEVEPRHEYLRQTGKPINQFFGWTVLRYYTPDDFITVDDKLVLKPELPQPQYPVQPGDFMYWDRNSDGYIDTYDKGPIGMTPVPALVYNFNAGVHFKGFDFNIMFQGAGLNSKLMTKSMYEPVREENRFQTIHLYRWTEERWRNGEKILYPRLSSKQNNHNQATNTFYLKRGDYLRLKNIELGYTFNKKQLSFFGLTSARVYVSGNNVYTWSEIKNFDPELGSSDGYFYPQMKLWNLGVNINF